METMKSTETTKGNGNGKPPAPADIATAIAGIEGSLASEPQETLTEWFGDLAERARDVTEPTRAGEALSALLFGRAPSGPVRPDARLVNAGVPVNVALRGPIERRARRAAAHAVGALGAEVLLRS